MNSSIAARFNADLLEENYTRWRKDPGSVDSPWAAFFEGFAIGAAQPAEGQSQLGVDTGKSESLRGYAG